MSLPGSLRVWRSKSSPGWLGGGMLRGAGETLIFLGNHGLCREDRAMVGRIHAGE